MGGVFGRVLLHMRELLDAWRRRTLVFVIELSVFLSEGNHEERVEDSGSTTLLKSYVRWGGGHDNIGLAYPVRPQLHLSLTKKNKTEIVEQF